MAAFSFIFGAPESNDSILLSTALSAYRCPWRDCVCTLTSFALAALLAELSAPTDDHTIERGFQRQQNRYQRFSGWRQQGSRLRRCTDDLRDREMRQTGNDAVPDLHQTRRHQEERVLFARLLQRLLE